MKKIIPNSDLLRFVLSGIAGVMVFFLPVPYGGGSTILLDLLVTFLLELAGRHIRWFILLACLWGVIQGTREFRAKPSAVMGILYFARWAGLLLCVMYILGAGPKIIYDPQVLPFLFDNICKSIIFLVPVGGVFLCLLTEYGLMEFVGSFLEGVMRRGWRIPGIAAVDVVASFVASFSLGFMLTDKMYQQGKYSAREAVIIATGFSTVSTTFLITLCKSLGIVQYWGWFFLISFLTNLVVTFVVSRFWPICSYDQSCAVPVDSGSRCSLRLALTRAAGRAASAGKLHRQMLSGFCAGCRMLGVMIPTILSVGTLGMLLVLHTPLFEYIGYVFYLPLRVLGFEYPAMLAKALSTTLIDTFLPVAFVAQANPEIRFFCGVVSVSEILFLTASIPALLSTTIPVKIRDLLIIWLERVMVSIIVAGVLTKALFIIL